MKHMTYKHITVFSDSLFVSGKYDNTKPSVKIGVPTWISLAVFGVLPELRVITMDGDSLRYIKWVFKDKLHVFSRAQADVE